MQCQHMRETSKSNSLRALYGEGGLSRLVQCKRRATRRVSGTGQTEHLCTVHYDSTYGWMSALPGWITSIERISGR